MVTSDVTGTTKITQGQCSICLLWNRIKLVALSPRLIAACWCHPLARRGWKFGVLTLSRIGARDRERATDDAL